NAERHETRYAVRYFRRRGEAGDGQSAGAGRLRPAGVGIPRGILQGDVDRGGFLRAAVRAADIARGGGGNDRPGIRSAVRPGGPAAQYSARPEARPPRLWRLTPPASQLRSSQSGENTQLCAVGCVRRAFAKPKNGASMPHHTPLIGTIVVGLVVAFLMGALAHRLRVSPVAGYLLAGVMVGPFTPGYVADTALATELAEIGVILLMFGVGLHFSLRDLMAVKNIAVPGAVVQIATATAMGTGLALWLGWSLAAGIIFGLALSVASTVVLLRALEARDLIQTERGRIAVGWLIVEDLAMVLALVMLPALAGILSGEASAGGNLASALGITVLKVGGFIALMLVFGKR